MTNPFRDQEKFMQASWQGTQVHGMDCSGIKTIFEKS
jgi:hypothetical protein